MNSFELVVVDNLDEFVVFVIFVMVFVAVAFVIVSFVVRKHPIMQLGLLHYFEY